MREYVASLATLLVGAVLVLVGYGATWAVATVPVFTGSTEGAPVSEVVLTGRDLAPIGSAAGWVALAGLAGLLATRTWGRRVIGAVIALACGTAGATALAFALTGASFIEATLQARSIGDVQASTVSTTTWWLVAMIGGLIAAVAGSLAIVRGPSWPRLSGRYERSASGGGADPDAPVSGIQAWDALDRGEDPTDPYPRSGSDT